MPACKKAFLLVNVVNPMAHGLIVHVWLWYLWGKSLTHNSLPISLHSTPQTPKPLLMNISSKCLESIQLFVVNLRSNCMEDFILMHFVLNVVIRCLEYQRECMTLVLLNGSWSYVYSCAGSLSLFVSAGAFNHQGRWALCGYIIL